MKPQKKSKKTVYNITNLQAHAKTKRTRRKGKPRPDVTPKVQEHIITVVVSSNDLATQQNLQTTILAEMQRADQIYNAFLATDQAYANKIRCNFHIRYSGSSVAAYYIPSERQFYLVNSANDEFVEKLPLQAILNHTGKGAIDIVRFKEKIAEWDGTNFHITNPEKAVDNRFIEENDPDESVFSFAKYISHANNQDMFILIDELVIAKISPQPQSQTQKTLVVDYDAKQFDIPTKVSKPVLRSIFKAPSVDKVTAPRTKNKRKIDETLDETLYESSLDKNQGNVAIYTKTAVGNDPNNNINNNNAGTKTIGSSDSSDKSIVVYDLASFTVFPPKERREAQTIIFQDDDGVYAEYSKDGNDRINPDTLLISRPISDDAWNKLEKHFDHIEVNQLDEISSPSRSPLSVRSPSPPQSPPSSPHSPQYSPRSSVSDIENEDTPEENQQELNELIKQRDALSEQLKRKQKLLSKQFDKTEDDLIDRRHSIHLSKTEHHGLLPSKQTSDSETPVTVDQVKADITKLQKRIRKIDVKNAEALFPTTAEVTSTAKSKAAKPTRERVRGRKSEPTNIHKR